MYCLPTEIKNSNQNNKCKEVEHIYSKLVLVFLAQMNSTLLETYLFPRVKFLQHIGKQAMTTLKSVNHNKTMW